MAKDILFLDVEGGWGGSSRSLFYLVEALDRTQWQPSVILRKDGPVVGRYAELGIASKVLPVMPSFRPAERKNWLSRALFEARWLKHGQAVTAGAAAMKPALIHANHESLALVGARLSKALGVPWTIHIRTLLHPGPWARAICRLIARSAAHVVFISERNAEHFARLAGACWDPARGSVIHNVAPFPSAGLEPHPALAGDEGAFKVLSLTNFTPIRGVDRVLDVAEELKSRGETGFVFHLCGHPGDTSRTTRDYVDAMKARTAAGLETMVRFPGHLSEPERALAAAGAVIRVPRLDNAWGRDIIESMTAGVPVVTLGTFQGFVEHGVTGYIEPEFDPRRIADFLIRLRNEPELRARMSQAAHQKALTLFDAGACAARMGEVLAKALETRNADHG